MRLNSRLSFAREYALKTAVSSAYLGVILIWSTTPLGIKWSGEQGISFLLGVSARMAIAALLAVLLVMLLQIPLRRTRTALQAYALSGLSIFTTMTCAYWGATYIPSGWLAVIWGTSPLLTGIFAYYALHESLSWQRISGLLLSLLGLGVIFWRSGEVGEQAWLGVLIVLLGVVAQSGFAVWLKALDAREHGLMMTTTGLLLSLPCFVLTWWLFDGHIPTAIPLRAGWAIVYLAVFGSLLGFSLYYFLINQISASALALVTLITPVTSLLLGSWFNHEVLTVSVYVGTGLILLGLAVYQWGNRYQPQQT